MKAFEGLGDLSARIEGLPSWVVGLAIGLLGVGGAWWYYNGAFEWWQVVAFLVVATVPIWLASSGRTLVKTDPVAAVKLIGFRTLATFLMASLGTAALIVIGAEVVAPTDSSTSPPTAPSPSDKQIFAALSAALTAAVTASLIKASSSIDGPSATAAKSAFVSTYMDNEDWRSPAREIAIYSEGTNGIVGWGRKARLKRAEKVKASPPS